MVRLAGDPLTFAPTLRKTMREIEPALVLAAVEPLDDTMAKSTAERRFMMIVLGVFAGVTLLLAVIGVHGLLSYTVAQRTRELGIRMALGAGGGALLRMVIRQGMVPVVAGVTLGLAGALAGGRVLRSLLFGVGAADPVTFVAVTGFLVGTALAAIYIPARRAARSDPMAALRSE
jgi:ABC-type antimicrobial peptide transport system permease subunit